LTPSEFESVFADRKEITSIDIEKNGVKWAMIDDVGRAVARPGKAFISNTATSDQDGIHWITIRRYGPTAFIFDPLGPRNVRPNDKMMVDTLRAAGVNKIAWFPHAVQDKQTTHCGWFALAVAKLINSQRPRTALGASRLVAQYFGPARSASRENVAQLLRSGGYVP